MRESLLPWGLVRVSGASMVPTLHHGDRLLVRATERPRVGDVVLATFRAVPGHVVVKRAVRPLDGGWWLVSDNPFAGGDSATHGVADVRARVVLVLRNGRWPGRVPGPPPPPSP